MGGCGSYFYPSAVHPLTQHLHSYQSISGVCPPACTRYLWTSPSRPASLSGCDPSEETTDLAINLSLHYQHATRQKWSACASTTNQTSQIEPHVYRSKTVPTDFLSSSKQYQENSPWRKMWRWQSSHWWLRWETAWSHVSADWTQSHNQNQPAKINTANCKQFSLLQHLWKWIVII